MSMGGGHFEVLGAAGSVGPCGESRSAVHSLVCLRAQQHNGCRLDSERILQGDASRKELERWLRVDQRKGDLVVRECLQSLDEACLCSHRHRGHATYVSFFSATNRKASTVGGEKK